MIVKTSDACHDVIVSTLLCVRWRDFNRNVHN